MTDEEAETQGVPDSHVATINALLEIVIDVNNEYSMAFRIAAAGVVLNTPAVRSTLLPALQNKFTIKESK